MKVYHVYYENPEIEGMFSEDGTYLGGWSLNDAVWRQEYFVEFMRNVGVQVTTPETKKLEKELIKKLKKELDV